jgi:hypothetical protein
MTIASALVSRAATLAAGPDLKHSAAAADGIVDATQFVVIGARSPMFGVRDSVG